jgi:hypothetical protein
MQMQLERYNGDKEKHQVLPRHTKRDGDQCKNKKRQTVDGIDAMNE